MFVTPSVQFFSTTQLRKLFSWLFVYRRKDSGILKANFMFCFTWL